MSGDEEILQGGTPESDEEREEDEVHYRFIKAMRAIIFIPRRARKRIKRLHKMSKQLKEK